MKKVLSAAFIVFIVCVTRGVQAGELDDIDKAIRKASDYLNENPAIKPKSKLLFLSVKSEYEDLSRYIIDKLIENTVNDKKFTVVDREHLDAIQREMDFQLSGEVPYESMRSIGRKLGAQTIITGDIKQWDVFLLRLCAVKIETAVIEGAVSVDLPAGAVKAVIAREKRRQEAEAKEGRKRLEKAKAAKRREHNG